MCRGDNLDQLRKLPDACADLIYIDPPFNSMPGIATHGRTRSVRTSAHNFEVGPDRARENPNSGVSSKENLAPND